MQATLTGIVFASLFGPAGVAVGVVLNVLVFFVLAEAVPKTYAVLYSERAALITARPTLWLVSFPPLKLISRGLISLTNVIVRGKGLRKGPFVSEQELLGIVEAAADDEVIEPEEMELVKSIIEFGDTVAREIMVPRPDLVTVRHTSTVSQALDVAMEHGFSRIPVINDDDEDEDVLGLAFVKDLYRAERDGGGERPVTDLVRDVHVVPEGKPVSRLMREMQAGKYHLALVADEYGALAGVITLEDCLEELVGEIVDEHDIEASAVERLADGDMIVARRDADLRSRRPPRAAPARRRVGHGRRVPVRHARARPGARRVDRPRRLAVHRGRGGGTPDPAGTSVVAVVGAC